MKSKPSRSLQQTRAHWERFAAEDPLWAILTEPGKRGGGWDPEAFFQSGAETVRAEMESLDRLAPGRATGRALDFGCGVGRLTQGLAPFYDEVVGVDISAGMIDLAESFNREPGKIRFLQNTAADLNLLASDQFDLVLSLITLQHMAPRHAFRYLAEFVRVARPGGLIVVQAPAGRIPEKSMVRRIRKRLLRNISWINRKLMIDRSPRMEMHMLPEDEVVRTLETAGASIVAAIADAGAGQNYTSMRYTARKQAAWEADGQSSGSES